jgi:hypothetical protein
LVKPSCSRAVNRGFELGQKFPLNLFPCTEGILLAEHKLNGVQ